MAIFFLGHIIYANLNTESTKFNDSEKSYIKSCTLIFALHKRENATNDSSFFSRLIYSRSTYCFDSLSRY